MKTLVDTCVLSEIARVGGDARVRERFQKIRDNDLYLSAITIGEIVSGIERLVPGTRRRSLEKGIREIQDLHEERIIPIDTRVARIWGTITANAQRIGVTIPAADGLIAATAIRHDLLVLTRNTSHFEATGARVEDPWA